MTSAKTAMEEEEEQEEMKERECVPGTLRGHILEEEEEQEARRDKKRKRGGGGGGGGGCGASAAAEASSGTGGRGGGGHRPIGIGVFPSAARFNHSCDPNAHQSFDSFGCVTVDTVRRVEKGEELTIPYVDTRLPREERRAKLRKNFAFDCACARCVAEEKEEKEKEKEKEDGGTARAAVNMKKRKI